jgi:hypothetical protein
MVGQLWLSLFRVRDQVDERRPAGVYGAAFVRYEEGSPLTYSELLVGRAVEPVEHGRRVTITDIWVDSPASVAGGRELWAIPKGLCDFTLESERTGPLSTTKWSASDGEERTSTLQGSAKSLPCRSSWDFDADGPLGWLRDARRLASFRMAGFRMSFT